MPRRSSNNPFSDSLSPSSTGGGAEDSSNTPPTYPSNNNDYYSTTNEKSRLRQQEQDRERSSQQQVDLPPSYEEAAGPKVSKSSYPREKSSSISSSSRPHRSQSDSERHRTRVNREWPGDGTNQQSSSTRPHRSTSGRTRESGSREHSSREHRDKERSHRSRSNREASESKSSRPHRSSSEKHSKSKDSKNKPKPKNVDTIDKLDVTGLFGGTFHHDGPFDACTPQRNKNQKSAPVLAFPADGPNNSIKGKAPENIKDSTIDYVMGRTSEFGDDDLYTASVSPRKQGQPLTNGNGNGINQPPLLGNIQYNSSNQSQSTIAAVKNTENITNFDTNKKAIPVHGETTLGLGSSTFLDGAPASQEDSNINGGSTGLNRKKSIKNKLRNPSPTFVDEDEPIKFSPEKSESSGGNSLLKRVRSLKVGRSRS
ncbi:Translation initiation factor IF-2 [Wickerhamomyces ciferrii]|uniref:Translation initiation factor IF-2 n=1 Tax=Wickerhamomyces ciferrii (strain ATCC 14091 / BCRC 22168 / CBS 111 / JCM 3599 / NBRC 0793 / NRRL Y-1031 F-60-10) TaxID=1206466 RepID=K0KTT1_WICCF|nr:Translation initiation factor IF-2 [Wickerhamomyces ciferrii]CCH45432.1 Translation initiation factor IF-2 [Wickerhamomyces ciferrii]